MLGTARKMDKIFGATMSMWNNAGGRPVAFHVAVDDGSGAVAQTPAVREPPHYPLAGVHRVQTCARWGGWWGGFLHPRGSRSAPGSPEFVQSLSLKSGVAKTIHPHQKIMEEQYRKLSNLYNSKKTVGTGWTKSKLTTESIFPYQPAKEGGGSVVTQEYSILYH